MFLVRRLNLKSRENNPIQFEMKHIFFNFSVKSKKTQKTVVSNQNYLMTQLWQIISETLQPHALFGEKTNLSKKIAQF